MSLTSTPKEVDSSRIWLGGLVTIVLSVIGNLILLWIANLLVEIPPEFEPLGPLRISVFHGGIFAGRHHCLRDFSGQSRTPYPHLSTHWLGISNRVVHPGYCHAFCGFHARGDGNGRYHSYAHPRRPWPHRPLFAASYDKSKITADFAERRASCSIYLINKQAMRDQLLAPNG